MNLFRAVLVILLFGSILVLSAQTADLTIKVEGIKQVDKSNIMIALYNEKDAFLDQDLIFKKVEVAADSASVEYTFTGLQHGIYAVSLYHDEDDDNEMDRKWYGPPKEGYGFSNNFTSNIRPARFNDASFELFEDRTIDIIIVY